MPTTFLRPQPGDGSWLLKQTSKSRGRKKKSFLKPSPVDSAEDAFDTQGRNDLSLPRTFLLPLPTTPPAPFHNLSTEPGPDHDSRTRTIAGKDLLSFLQPQLPHAEQVLHLDNQVSATGLLPDQAPSNYTHQDAEAPAEPVEEESSMAVPPHLRKKKPAASAVPTKLTPPIHPTEVKDKLSELGCRLTPPVDGTEVKGKLSELGCKIDEPQPAVGAVANGDDDHERDPDPVFKGRGKRTDRFYAYLKAGQPVRSRNKNWPTAAEQRPDPKQHETKWEYSSSSGIPSDWADAGVDGAKKKRAAVDESNFKLEDFNGGWAPAPIDWDARPAFRDSTKVSKIEAWMDEHEKLLAKLDRIIDRHGVLSDAELVPRYWKLEVIGSNQTPNAFFAELVASEAPPPLDDDDLTDARPWWDTYVSSDSGVTMLKAYEHPVIDGVDPDETANERMLRDADEGSGQHAENRKRFEIAKKDAARHKRERAQEKAKKAASSLGADATLVKRIKPGLNIYVRSARQTDMVQVRDIYNYYVNFTACTPETEPRTTADMTSRWQGIMKNRLPFLVACERGARVPARRKKGRQYGEDEDLFLPDRIVGFASADDYQDMMGMYRFTCEVEVYVLVGCYMKAIATCLLDKMMAMLDPEYIERGGFDIQGEELEGCGPSRVISNIIAHVPYDRPERLEWKGRFLEAWKFEQMGNLANIGVKEGKNVSLAMFVRRTAAVVDPASPPVMMSYT